MFGLTARFVQIAVWAFGLAIYQIWFKTMWDDYILSQGWTVGIAETALGYGLAIIIIIIIQKLVTWRVKG